MRKSSASLLIVLLVFSLSTCDYLLDSTFDNLITYMARQVNISSVIQYGQGGDYNIRVVNSSTSEYVVVFGESTTYGERMAIYTSDLELVIQVDEKSGENNIKADGLLMFDADGNLYAGDLVFGATLQSPSDAGWITGWPHGYFDRGTNTFTFPFIDLAPSDTCQAEQWSSPAATEPAGILGPLSISGGSNAYDDLNFLYHDQGRNLVALYLEPNDTPERHIQGIIGSDNDFFGSLADPIDSDARFF